MVNEHLDDASTLRKYEHQIARLKAMLKKSTLQQHAPTVSPRDSEELEELRRENLFLMNQVKDVRKKLYVSEEETRAMRKVLRSDSDELSAARESLEAQRVALEKRMKDVAQTQERQREQTEWLRKYHQWLRSLPVDEKEQKASLDLKGRLNLLEWSVLMQSEELQRTKRAFLQELHPLQEELQHKSAMLEEAEARESKLRMMSSMTTRRVVEQERE